MPFFDSAPLLIATGNNEKSQIKSKVITVKNSMMKTVNTDMIGIESVLCEEEKEKREDDGEEITTTTTTTTTTAAPAAAAAAAGIRIKDVTLSDGMTDTKKEGAKKSAIDDDRERQVAVCHTLARKIIKR